MKTQEIFYNSEIELIKKIFKTLKPIMKLSLNKDTFKMYNIVYGKILDFKNARFEGDEFLFLVTTLQIFKDEVGNLIGGNDIKNLNSIINKLDTLLPIIEFGTRIGSSKIILSCSTPNNHNKNKSKYRNNKISHIL